jgi:lipopolysaccharide transport system permease protein
MQTVLRPTRGWVAIDAAELFRFKDLLFEFANRDVKLRYRQTLLGIVWVVLQPLFATGLLYFAFRVVAGVEPPEGAPFFLFTFAGLLLWNLFSATLSRASTSMVGNSYLVSKVYFPRLLLPLSGTISTVIDFAVSSVVLLAMLVIYRVDPELQIVLLPLWIAATLCLALGLGLIAAALTVGYRDVQHILPMVVPFMLYASPVAYDVSRIAPRYQTIFYLINPLAPLLAGFRWSILDTPLPPFPFILWSVFVAIGLFMLGAAVFRRAERKFADVI